MNIVPFTFNSNKKIIFRAGSVENLADEAGFYGKNIILFTGGSSLEKSGKLAEITKSLEENGFSITKFSVNSEPSPELVDSIVKQLKDLKIDSITAIGGGSVIDTGKAVSAMLCEEGSVCNLLEGIGDRTPTGRKIPFIAVPTTAGTGSEATSNAVLSRVGDAGFKKSLRHFNYTPDVAIIDSKLYSSCPPAVAASSGMDALSQLVEAYISSNASFYSDIRVIGAIEVLLEALPIVAATKDEQEYCGEACANAWNKMAYAAFISGTALANCGLSVVHGIAGSVGGFFNSPHGAICGTLLAEGMKQTIIKLENENPESASLLKFAKLGYIAARSEDLLPKEARYRFIQVLEGLTESLDIPRLSAFGITESDLPRIAAASSNKNNPISLSLEEITSILRERL
ncbi:MAG: iron-containing alcohol dehydrogenase [Spirochaetales bacterium]|nr:iron-containing alcohol dehydrogenase [Spirochaetales bacterium]